MLNRKAVALLTGFVMLFTVLLTGAAAEGSADLTTAMPLIDLTVSSAVLTGDYPESVNEGGYVSNAFTQSFFRDGVNAGVGITAEMAADADKQAEYMKQVFIPGAAELTAVEAGSQNGPFIGLYVFSQKYDETTQIGTVIGNVYKAPAAIRNLSADQLDELEWLDVRMQVTVASDPASPALWRVLSFGPDSPEIIEAVEEHINSHMLEYVNAEAGYTIQYPAVFDESVTIEEASGMSGALADGSASFSVTAEPAADGRSAVEMAETLAAAHEGAVTTINDITGTCRVVWKQADGKTVMNIIIVSGDCVYRAEMSYAPALALEFSLYSEYMMNSFTADAIGIG